MLQKEELRIGNYIFGKTVNGFKDIVEQVLALTQDGIATSSFRVELTGSERIILQEVDTRLTLPYGWANGIPITSDWLLNFGFTLDVYEYQTYSRNGMGLRLVAGKCKVYHEQAEFGMPLEFVHQLQNLYYELNRNPLSIVST